MKILIVANTQVDRAHLRRLVRQFPQRYAIDEAATGQAALERLAAERYHCVLLDYGLRDMTAAQILSSLDRGARDAPPVILLSDGDDEAARHSLEFLLKTAGLTVRSFDGAQAFLNVLPQIKSGCIITDVRMPEITGIDLLRKIKGAHEGLLEFMETQYISVTW